MKVEGKTVILPKIGPVAMVEQLRFAGSIPGGDHQPDRWMSGLPAFAWRTASRLPP